MAVAGARAEHRNSLAPGVGTAFLVLIREGQLDGGVRAPSVRVATEWYMYYTIQCWRTDGTVVLRSRCEPAGGDGHADAPSACLCYT